MRRPKLRLLVASAAVVLVAPLLTLASVSTASASVPYSVSLSTTSVTEPAGIYAEVDVTLNSQNGVCDASPASPVTLNGFGPTNLNFAGGHWQFTQCDTPVAGYVYASQPGTYSVQVQPWYGSYNSAYVLATFTLTVTDPLTVVLSGSFTTTPGVHATVYATVPTPAGGCPISSADNKQLLVELGATDGVTNSAPLYTSVAACDAPVAFQFWSNVLGQHPIVAYEGNVVDPVATATLNVVPVATTPPTITAPDVTKEATGPNTAVTFGAAATDQFGANVPVSYSPNGPFSVGTHTVTVSATDSQGGTATKDFQVTVTDTTAPTLNLPADITTTATANSQATVNYTASANDLVDGPVPVTCTTASGGSFPAGTTLVTCSATDGHNNTATGHFQVAVSYKWTGFYQPVDNLPTANTAKAGQSIPIIFSLNGYQGLNVFAAGYPASTAGSVPPADGSDAIEVYATSTPGLTYSVANDKYTYVWKTDKSWAGTSRVLTLKLSDGSTHQALVTFK